MNGNIPIWKLKKSDKTLHVPEFFEMRLKLPRAPLIFQWEGRSWSFGTDCTRPMTSSTKIDVFNAETHLFYTNNIENYIKICIKLGTIVRQDSNLQSSGRGSDELTNSSTPLVPLPFVIQELCHLKFSQNRRKGNKWDKGIGWLIRPMTWRLQVRILSYNGAQFYAFFYVKPNLGRITEKLEVLVAQQKCVPHYYLLAIG